MIGWAEPPFRHIQLALDQGVAVLAGVGGDDTGLAIGDLAERAAPLARYADRVAALFGKVAAIEDQHAALEIAEGLSDEGAMGGKNGGIIPSAKADELLQGLDVAIFVRQSHRFNRFAVEIGELALKIGQGPVALFGPHKQRGEVGVIGEQVVCERRDIAGRQVDDRWLA